MIKAKTILFVIASLFSIISCSKKSENYIRIFYNAQYDLTKAAYNDDYVVSLEPAYFNQIKDSTNCIELFDLKNCYCIYRTEVVNNKPIGKADIKISFKDNSLETFYAKFDYYSDYDRSYGGQIHVIGESVNGIGIQCVRGKYWWSRMDCTLPQLDNKRVILEFGNPKAFDDLPDFDGNTIFS